MPRPAHEKEAAWFAQQLRQEMPWSEARLWLSIRNRATGAKFRRQVPIGTWIADFACLNPKIVIEVDGASHDFRDEEERTAYIESQGFTILRFNNEDIRNNMTNVFDDIVREVERLRGE